MMHRCSLTALPLCAMLVSPALAACGAASIAARHESSISTDPAELLTTWFAYETGTDQKYGIRIAVS
ncbi:MAG: hypothetical protein IJ480_08400 [Clostridia bacterium]|nr:hypothetical protein [Clostridia bacterium]